MYQFRVARLHCSPNDQLNKAQVGLTEAPPRAEHLEAVAGSL